MGPSSQLPEWLPGQFCKLRQGANPVWFYLAAGSVLLNIYQYVSFNTYAARHAACGLSEDIARGSGHFPQRTSWTGVGQPDLFHRVVDADLAADLVVRAPYRGDRHLASAATSGCGSAGSAHAGAHEAHQHDALLFLFNAVIIGISIMHLKFFKSLQGMQETVALFCVGVVYSLVQHGLGVKDDVGKFGLSYDMWMDIDPHLLLFTLLPALLTGDAMTIDTSVAKQVSKQCVYLAGPGVLLNAVCAGWFLKFYFNWSFLLSLCTGAILCATDPVAVVALLKELGASPVLTIQIQGESLLNDGTAIVLYSVAYKMLQGESYDGSDLIMFLITVAFMAWALGMVIGYVFFLWIRAANNKLNHSSSIIQIALTIAAGYWAFVMAEGVFHISGVLATVASALTLAHFMWPHVVCPESMHHVWHMLETLGNILIFFLAGALTGKAMTSIDAIDYIHLIVIYIVLTIMRGSFIFASRPILRLLSQDGAPVSKADCCVMTWGGLRGAVGLALAIQVYKDRAPDPNGVEQISSSDAERVLFFVGGVAFLTTIVNATTCPKLVERLGITAQSDSRMRFIKLLHSRLAAYAGSDKLSPGAHASLSKVLNEVEHHISHRQTLAPEDETLTESHVADSERIAEIRQISGINLARKGKDAPADVEDLARIKEEFEIAKELLNSIHEEQLNLLGYDDDVNLSMASLLEKARCRESAYSRGIENAKDEQVDWGMAKLFTQVFLHLVRAAYWQQIDKRTLPPGSEEANVLLRSTQMCLSYPSCDLRDFNFVFVHFMNVEEDNSVVLKSKSLEKAQTLALDARKTKSDQDGPLKQLLDSARWNILIAGVILANGIYVGIEETTRDTDSSEDKNVWLSIEILFNIVFLIEACIKLAQAKHRYFYTAWNIFDFVLVSLGWFGIVVEAAYGGSQGGGAIPDSEARLLRLTRVFKVARLLRLFRLVNLFFALLVKLDSHEFSTYQGIHLKKYTALTSFMKAHMQAQRDFVKLLIDWDDGKDDDVIWGENGSASRHLNLEMARVLTQSSGTIYKAAALAVLAIQHINRATLMNIADVSESKDIAEEIESLVIEALDRGVLSGTDADCMTHPLHEHILRCQWIVNKAVQGFDMDVELAEEIEPPTNHHDHHRGSRKSRIGPIAKEPVHPHRITSLNGAEPGTEAASASAGNSPSPGSHNHQTTSASPELVFSFNDNAPEVLPGGVVVEDDLKGILPQPPPGQPHKM